jgi:hypothetical protein
MYSLSGNTAATSKFYAPGGRYEASVLLGDRKILDATVKYLVATATWRLGYGHPCCRHTRDMENNRFFQFILHVFYLHILAKYR